MLHRASIGAPELEQSWLYLFTVMLDAGSNATAAHLCQGQVCVEGSRLVGVLAVAQPRHLAQRHAHLRRGAAPSYKQYAMPVLGFQCLTAGSQPQMMLCQACISNSCVEAAASNYFLLSRSDNICKTSTCQDLILELDRIRDSTFVGLQRAYPLLTFSSLSTSSVFK